MDQKLSLELRCIHKPDDIGDRVCNGELAGPSMVTLMSHDFSEPFEDIRYCGRCLHFLHIKIKSLTCVPEITPIPKKTINFVPVNDVFGLSVIEARN